MNLARHVARNAKAYPDAPALAVGPRVVATWREMETHVARLAGGLRMTLGPAPGECVALIMRSPGSRGGALCPLACRPHQVPINAKLHPKELAYIVDHSQARVVFATPDLAQAVNEAVADAGARARDRHRHAFEHRALAGADPIAIARVEPDDLALAFLHQRHHRRPKGDASATATNFRDTSYFIDTTRRSPAARSSMPRRCRRLGVYMIPSAAQGNRRVIPRATISTPARCSACSTTGATSRCSPRRR